jgi:hypothetical protein
MVVNGCGLVGVDEHSMTVRQLFHCLGLQMGQSLDQGFCNLLKMDQSKG